MHIYGWLEDGWVGWWYVESAWTRLEEVSWLEWLWEQG